MIEFNISVKRHIWQSKNAFVEDHLNELNESKEHLKKFGWEYRFLLFGSEDLLKKAQRLIEDEIEYCLFYQYFQTQRALPDFDKWVFVERTSKTEYGRTTDIPERWVRCNGRIKSSVIINRGGNMVKIYTLHENDNPHLDFLSDNKEHTEPSYLSNEKSIANKIEQLKNEAVTYQRDHRFPRYLSEKGSFEALKDLLCTED